MVGNTSPVSIVIRTLNEERYLPNCLEAIKSQVYSSAIDLVLVDSGSVDSTVSIAEQHGCKVVRIKKSDFSFGRALNIGIANANHDVIVVISAHCVPASDYWLQELVCPLQSGEAEMVYGSHSADPFARSSEINYFEKKYSGSEGVKVRPRFNNGNSAFLKKLWLARPFNEYVPAQEDIVFSSWHMERGATLFYAPKARVCHYHNDKNKTLFARIHKETYVELMLGERNLVWFFLSMLSIPKRIVLDFSLAKKRGVFVRAFRGIIFFRLVEGAAYGFAVFNFFKKKWKRDAGVI